ncbi:MAG: hypothetical protein KBD78_16445 [Oligoflexales bacterium]|nr:hypothetical protein [Oligoflexales bacterium]
MTTAELEIELRTKYPDMFSHPKLQEGEIYIDSQLTEVAAVNAAYRRSAGLTSARIGETFLRKNEDGSEFTYNPIFANLQQYLELEIAHRGAQ